MEKLQNNHFFKSVLIVLLSIGVLILIIAIFIKVDEYRRNSFKLDASFKNSGIVKLTNKLPISDSIGKNYTGSGVEKGIAEYKEFSISNPNSRKVTYEIYLTKIISNSKEIRSNYIKLYLTDNNNNPMKGFGNKKVINYYELASLSDKPGGRLLYTGSLDAGKNQKFILRSWVADTYILSSEEENFNYNINVRIK